MRVKSNNTRTPIRNLLSIVSRNNPIPINWGITGKIIAAYIISLAMGCWITYELSLYFSK